MLPMVKRLLALYDRAAPQQRERGLVWYSEAHAAVQALSATGPYTVHQAAATVAVLSPRLRWSVNLALAHHAIVSHQRGARVRPPAVFGSSWSKAMAILDGDDAALSGAKVRCFYSCLLGDQNAIAVDTWAARAALGKEIPNASWVARHYSTLERAYRQAAKCRGVPPREFQAVVWTVIRDAGRSWPAALAA